MIGHSNSAAKQAAELRRSRIRTATVLLVGVALFCLFIFGTYFYEYDDFSSREILGVLIVVTGFIPSLEYLWRLRNHKTSEAIPFVPILGIVYIVYYGIPALSDKNIEVVAPDEAILKALWLALIGWCALLYSFYAIGLKFSMLRPLRMEWSPERAKIASFWLLVVGSLSSGFFANRFIPAELQQIFSFISFFKELGLGILIILSLRNLLNSFWNIMIWFILVPVFLLLQIQTGSVAPLVLSALYIFMLFWACRSRLPWGLVLVVIVFSILLKGVLKDYRLEFWNEDPTVITTSSISERTFFIFDEINRKFQEKGLEAFYESSDVVSDRLSLVSTFAHVVWLTPEQIPYWGGATYAALPSIFVPRILWPDKPQKDLGQAFGHRYEILHPEDEITSVNLPQLIEFYINFGDAGVLIGMSLMGILYGLMYAKLNTPNSGDSVVLISAAIFSRLTTLESDFSLAFGGIIQTTIILYVILRFIRLPENRQAQGRLA